MVGRSDCRYADMCVKCSHRCSRAFCCSSAACVLSSIATLSLLRGSDSASLAVALHLLSNLSKAGPSRLGAEPPVAKERSYSMAVEQRTGEASRRLLAEKERWVSKGVATSPIFVERAHGARLVD